MNRRVCIPLALAAAFGVVAGSVVLPSVAVAKDDPVAIKEARDKFRKAQEDKGVLTYFDLSYGVDRGSKESPKIDSRWSKSKFRSDTTDEKGVQLELVFSDSKFPEGAGISIMVQKFIHKNATSEFSLPFERANKSPKCADPKAMLDGFYCETVAIYKDPVKDKCIAEKKVKLGVADLFATFVGTNPDSQKRERKDWYIWKSPNTTWVLAATYTGVCAEKAETFSDKVEEVVKAHKELKAPD